jgi:hypothetical protein
LLYTDCKPPDGVFLKWTGIVEGQQGMVFQLQHVGHSHVDVLFFLCNDDGRGLCFAKVVAGNSYCSTILLVNGEQGTIMQVDHAGVTAVAGAGR